MVEAPDANQQFLDNSFKHFGSTAKVTFRGVTANDTNEHYGVAMNGKMIAVNWSSTSSIAVFGIGEAQTFDPKIPLLKSHTGNILDMQWSPFEERLLATCADDGKVKMWVFDDENGLTGKGHQTECDLEIEAHHRKCLSIQWHDSVENLVATHSIDKTVKIWDINEDKFDEPVITFAEFGNDYCTNIKWSPDGKMIGGMSKQKQMFVFDPRTEGAAMSTASHVGPKMQRIDWVDNNTIITTGFSKEVVREYGVWDVRNLEQPLMKGPLFGGSGIPYFFFDREYKQMFLHGRGDNSFSVYQFDLTNAQGILTHGTNVPLGKDSTKGFCVAPKHCVDVSKQEIFRAARTTSGNTLEILQLAVPSKQGTFNAAYYPPFQANEPSNQAEAWIAGTDVEPKTMQLGPAKKAAKKSGGGLKNRLGGAAKPAAAATEEVKGGEDTAALHAQIAKLQADLAAAQAQGSSISVVAVEDLSTVPVLGYWTIRGLAAQIRMMFYYLNVNFEDKLYDCGPAPDFDRTCWTDVKPNMGMEYPNLPYLIDGETKISETCGIMMYIAKKYQPELLGRDAAELGRIHMLVAHVGNLKGKATTPAYMGGDLEAMIEECRPILSQIVDCMGESDWIAGANLTWLDFYFAELVDMLDKLTDGLFNAEFPSLQTYWERFISLPNLAEAWADDSKLMKTPFNNKMAKYLNE